MQKVSNMTKEELAHYGTLIGEAFAAEGDGIATTAPREDIIKAFEIMTEYFYNSGVLYTTSDNHEGFLAYWRKSTKIKLKPALHMVGRMLREMSFRSVRIVAGSSEELYSKVYKKEKDYVAVSMVVVLREYQGKGYGKQAVLSLLDRLHTEYQSGTVYLSVYENNPHAIKLYQQIGFRFNGKYTAF